MLEEHDPVKWGIIGCGNIAVNAVAPAMQWSRIACIEGVASRHAPRAEHLAKQLGARKSFGSYEALLADETIEAVYIATPNHLHEEWIIKCAKAGKHVLCEKSLALDSASTSRISKAVRKAGVQLMDAFMYRHHPQWEVVRKLIESGKLGKIKTIRAGLTGTLGEKQNHRWTESEGGGALYDVTCYGINVARFLLGREPEKVCSFADRNNPARVDATSSAMLDFGDGVTALVHGSLETRHTQYCTIEGTVARLVVPSPFIPGFNETMIVVESEQKTGKFPEHFHVQGANHYLHMIEHFCLCLREKDRPFAPAEDGSAQAAVLQACNQSWDSGQVVSV